MVDILQIKQSDQVPVNYEVTENGLDLKNAAGNTIITIPVMSGRDLEDQHKDQGS